MERLPNNLYTNFSKVFIVLLLSDSIVVFEFNVDDSLSYEPRSIVEWRARGRAVSSSGANPAVADVCANPSMCPCGLFPEFAKACSKALIGEYRIRVSKVADLGDPDFGDSFTGSLL